MLATFDEGYDFRSLINKLNKSGLRYQPCLTPFKQGKEGEELLFMVTLKVTFVYINFSIIM